MAELLSTVDAAGIDRTGLALSDPIRRAVLLELLTGPACPSDLAGRLSASRPSLSNHLVCLRGCGLLRAERAGRYLCYELVNDDLAGALRMLVPLADSTRPFQGRRP